MNMMITLTATLITAFMGSGLNPAIPALSTEFGLSTAASGWIITAYMLACSALPVPFGRLTGIVDDKKLLTIGLGIFSLSSAGGAAAANYGILLGMRVLQGTGTAMVYSTSMSILVSERGLEERGRLLGYSTAATYLGLSAGPAVGGILSSQLGWRWIFLATAGVSAVAFFCALKVIVCSGRHKIVKSGFGKSASRSFPSRQSVLLYISWMVLMLSGLSAVSVTWWGYLVFIAGAGLLVYFIWSQRKCMDSVLPVKIFWKRKVFGAACIAAMVNYGTNFVLNYLLSLYFQTALGLSAMTAGFILAISPAVQAVISPFAGKAADGKTGPGRLSALGMLGTAAVTAGFGLIQSETPLWILCTGLALAGISCALFAAPNTVIVMKEVGERYESMAPAVLSTVRSLGHSISVASACTVSTAVYGSGALTSIRPEQILTILHYIFFLWSFLCFSAFIMALRKKV